MPCPKEVIYENTLCFIFCKNFILPPCQIIYQMLKNEKITSALKLILITLLSVDLIKFCVSSWRICDVRGNRISTGEFNKINFPRNEAKQFKLRNLFTELLQFKHSTSSI